MLVSVLTFCPPCSLLGFKGAGAGFGKEVGEGVGEGDVKGDVKGVRLALLRVWVGVRGGAIWAGDDSILTLGGGVTFV